MLHVFFLHYLWQGDYTAGCVCLSDYQQNNSYFIEIDDSISSSRKVLHCFIIVVGIGLLSIGGRGPVSSSSSSALHRWLVAVTLQSRRASKVVRWSLWIFSVELSSVNFVKYLCLQPHDLSLSSLAVFSRYLFLCILPTFGDRIIPNGFFPPLGGVLGAAKLALAWLTEELPSTSPVAFLTTGNFQLSLI